MTERHNPTRHHREYASDESSISFSKKIQRTRKTFKDDVKSDLSSSSDESTTTTNRIRTKKAGKRKTPRKPDQKETGTKTKTPGTSEKRDKKQQKRNTDEREKMKRHSESNRAEHLNRKENNKRRSRTDPTKQNKQAHNNRGERKDTETTTQRLGGMGDNKQRTKSTKTQQNKKGKNYEKKRLLTNQASNTNAQTGMKDEGLAQQQQTRKTRTNKGNQVKREITSTNHRKNLAS